MKKIKKILVFLAACGFFACVFVSKFWKKKEKAA